MTRYLLATDVGGTCTDTIVFAAGEPVHLGKTLSTPPNFPIGVLDSIRSAATCDGHHRSSELLAQTSLFMHGSTVVDNTILTRDGARTGLITTRGFEDTVLITRGAYGRWGGLTEDRIKHPVKTDRAPPLVDPDCIVGVAERADYKGAMFLDLDEAATEAALRFLIDEKQVEALAVSLLWSFYNPENEQQGARRDRADRARRLLHPVERDCADSGRIRALVDHGHQRLCRAHHAVLFATACRRCCQGRLSRARDGDAGLWRAAAGSGGGRSFDRHAGVRSGGGRDRQPRAWANCWASPT